MGEAESGGCRARIRRSLACDVSDNIVFVDRRVVFSVGCSLLAVSPMLRFVGYHNTDCSAVLHSHYDPVIRL